MLFDFTLPPRKYNKPNFKQVQTNLLRTQPGRSVIAAAEQSLKSWWSEYPISTEIRYVPTVSAPAVLRVGSPYSSVVGQSRVAES